MRYARCMWLRIKLHGVDRDFNLLLFVINRRNSLGYTRALFLFSFDSSFYPVKMKLIYQHKSLLLYTHRYVLMSLSNQTNYTFYVSNRIRYLPGRSITLMVSQFMQGTPKLWTVSTRFLNTHKSRQEGQKVYLKRDRKSSKFTVIMETADATRCSFENHIQSGSKKYPRY